MGFGWGGVVWWVLLGEIGNQRKRYRVVSFLGAEVVSWKCGVYHPGYRMVRGSETRVVVGG